MKLVTKELEKKFAANPIYSKDGQGKKAEVIAKYFLTGTAATWLVTEAQKLDDGDYEFFGYVDLGYGYEAGYFYLSQLAGLKNRMGLGVERDIYASGTVEQLM